MPLLSVILFYAIVLFSGQANSNTSHALKFPIHAGADKILVHNGQVGIAYDDQGKGPVTLVFIHGWCLNRSYWAGQVADFKSHYRVITLDLPGFGASGKNRKNWSVEAYASDITALLTQLNLHEVILIGHSTSGSVALEAALQNKTRVIGLVGIDNFKDIGQIESVDSKKDEANFFTAARINFKPLAYAYASEALFSKSTDTLVKNRVLSDLGKADSLIAIECLERAAMYDVLPHLKRLKKRLYLINSDLTPTDTTGLVKQAIGYKIFTLHGTGHFPMIESPVEFNSLLAKAVLLISGHKD